MKSTTAPPQKLEVVMSKSGNISQRDPGIVDGTQLPKAKRCSHGIVMKGNEENKKDSVTKWKDTSGKTRGEGRLEQQETGSPLLPLTDSDGEDVGVCKRTGEYVGVPGAVGKGDGEEPAEEA
ncbi:hypothetical protein NDU88_008577 [Pleurodeles waltl]|uniref:Uncharacterized protein n=1 Tax=Pleurodeles waltl TaxID=8319 RepID=A0AAV7N5E4_PLEWA|nr:hypothetical protein NDU88_008577 [Pleurodeles waltl]